MLVLTPRDDEKVFDPAQVYGADEKAG
jgi:hypothetical protein